MSGMERPSNIEGPEIDNVHKIANSFCKYFSTIPSSLKTPAHPLTKFNWHSPTALQFRTSPRFRFSYVSVLNVSPLKRFKCN